MTRPRARVVLSTAIVEEGDGTERLRQKLGRMPETVVVQRALPGLGDFLCAVPALRAVRATLPEARVTLIGLPQTEALVRRFARYVDELLPFPGFPGIPEVAPDISALPRFFAEAQERRFDLALQLHGSGLHINAFVLLLGARVSAGLHLAGQERPGDLFVPYAVRGHEIDRLLAVTEGLGALTRGRHLEWPVLDGDEADARRLLGGMGGRPYAVLHPGATAPARRWPLDGFVSVGRGLARRGLKLVVTGAPGERGLAARLVAGLGDTALDLSGRTTLGGLAEAVRGARLVICNDTGVSHLTAAVGTPSVVVFVGSDPDRWAPTDRVLHRPVGRPFPDADEGRWLPEEHCLGDGCARAPWAGLRTPSGAVSAEMVLREAEELLSRVPGEGDPGSGATAPATAALPASVEREGEAPCEAAGEEGPCARCAS